MRDRCSQLHCSNGRAGRRCSRDAFAPGSCHGESPDGRRELWRLLAPIPLSPFAACAARATSPRRGEVKVRILVIARSGSDEAIRDAANHAARISMRSLSRAGHSAGPVGSPMTRCGDVLATHHARVLPTTTPVNRFAPRQSKRERSAERRIQPMPRGTTHAAITPFGRGARRRQVYAICATHLLRGALAFRRSAAALARALTP